MIAVSPQRRTPPWRAEGRSALCPRPVRQSTATVHRRVGHSILTIAYHLLSDPERRYSDLGADYFELTDKQRLAQNLIR